MFYGDEINSEVDFWPDLVWSWPWPVTLKTFWVLPTHMMNNYDKIYWNPFINGRKDGQTTRKHNASIIYTMCRRNEGKQKIARLEESIREKLSAKTPILIYHISLLRCQTSSDWWACTVPKYHRKPSTCLLAKSLFMHKSSCKVLTKTTMLRNVSG